MKLVKMNHTQVGPLVLLPEGAFAIDVVGSLGVVAHDPLANGLLNGAFKESGDWSLIVKHWAHLRGPLKKLVRVAQSYPEHPGLLLQPLNQDAETADALDPIIAIEIEDIDTLEELDPTGRRAMERQFLRPAEIQTPSDGATAKAGQVIDFLLHKDEAARS
jgi:hypothetical protein